MNVLTPKKIEMLLAMVLKVKASAKELKVYYVVSTNEVCVFKLNEYDNEYKEWHPLFDFMQLEDFYKANTLEVDSVWTITKFAFEASITSTLDALNILREAADYGHILMTLNGDTY